MKKTMGHPTIVAILASIFFFNVSCTDDSNSEDTPLQEDFILVGTWNLVKVDVTATISGNSSSDTDDSPTGTFKFNADGTGTSSYQFSVFDDTFVSNSGITYTLNGNTLTVIDETPKTFVFMLSNKQVNSVRANTDDITLGTAATDIDIFLSK